MFHTLKNKSKINVVGLVTRNVQKSKLVFNSFPFATLFNSILHIVS